MPRFQGFQDIRAQPSEVHPTIGHGTWELISVVESGELQSGDMQWVVDGDYYDIVVSQQRVMILATLPSNHATAGLTYSAPTRQPERLAAS